jgi:hypothetical protein
MAPPLTTFPAFPDWRVSYIGQNGRLTIVALDGQTSLVGPFLPIRGPQGLGLFTPGTSPDGKHLAYDGGDGIVSIDVHATQLDYFYNDTVFNNTFIWAPDGHAAAIFGPAIVALPSGDETMAIGNNRDAQGQPLVTTIYGWLDSSHLAVDYLPGTQAPDATPSQSGTPTIAANLYSLDLVTTALHRIATIHSDALGAPNFSLAPDSGSAIFYKSLFYKAERASGSMR